MRIGFDLRPFLREETGVGVYFRNLLVELARIDREDEFFLFSASWKDRFAADRVPPFARKRFRDLRWPVRTVNYFWSRLRRPTLDTIFGERLDLTHSPTPLVLPTRGRTIVTVCDLVFLERPELADADARRHLAGRTEASLRRADGIIAISEFTKRSLVSRFGLAAHKIKVTPLGLSELFAGPADEAAVERTRRTLGLPAEFLLFVGASEPRKNLPRLVDALALVHRQLGKIPLVLVGRPGADEKALLARIEARGLQSSVVLPGYLDEAAVRDLYRAAAALVFPSYGEGFGLPVIEAMAAGLPVAASAVSALPEVGGDAAVYFDPESVEDMADKIIAVLQDEALRRTLRSRGLERAKEFRWDRTAAMTLDFYRAVLGSP